LNIDVPHTDRTDEMGQLATSLSIMSKNLFSLTSEIKKIVEVLGEVSTQSISIVEEISKSTTSIATNVNETTEAVNHLKETFAFSKSKTGYVEKVSQEAVKISKQGEASVRDTTESINQIKLQMETISGSILKLNDKTQEIDEIVGTVSEFSEQSNLLAVNASIEAAKADEHGKGFAVVAQEVKNLAERSKEATLEIQNILNETRKVTEGAVLAAERGMQTVDKGLQRTEHSSESISNLFNNVEDTAEAVTQVITTSREQTVGVDQVLQAMESIRESSNQHLESIEYIEGSSRKLHSLGQSLDTMLKEYKV